MKRLMVASLVTVSLLVTVYIAAPAVSTQVAVWLGTVEVAPSPTTPDESRRLLEDAGKTIELTPAAEGRVLDLSK